MSEKERKAGQVIVEVIKQHLGDDNPLGMTRTIDSRYGGGKASWDGAIAMDMTASP